MGTILGPITASYITLATSFRTCCDLFAVLVLFFALLYFLIILIPQRIKAKKQTAMRIKEHQLASELEPMVEMKSKTDYKL
jgi:MFS family permease